MDETPKTAAARPLPAAALRMIDANRNRAAEGLRVVEDYCRFGLGDRHLAGFCKSLRHDLATALASICAESLLTARETQQDVGTTLSTPQEANRQSLVEIAAAACQRVQQALRVIEECLKLADAAAAARIEALRYRCYTLGKAYATTAESRRLLADARLYVLVDGKASGCKFVEHIQALIAAGVGAIQLRDKQLNDRTLLARARLLRRTIDDQIPLAEPRTPNPEPFPDHAPRTTHQPPATSHRPLLIINDRPDLAVLARADGVHVGQEELTVHEVRQIVGTDMLIGVSTHSIEQARQAVLDGANYIGCGPVFPSSTKQFDQFPGLEFLRQVAAEIVLPAFAIGGIMRENLSLVLSTGIRRIAIGRAIADSDQAGMEAAALLALLKE